MGRLVLDTLRHDEQPETVPELDRGADDRRARVVDDHRPHERPVDLDRVDVQTIEISERRVAGTKVVDRDANTERPQPREDLDRAFRIGQKRHVVVHKFVCRGTVEERIDAMIRDKRTVADQLLNQGTEALLTEIRLWQAEAKRS